MLRLPHFLDNQFTDGGEVVSPMHWLPFNPRAIVQLKGLGQLKGKIIINSTMEVQ
jgi:hypothetical protein